jgi:hypothetical protein
VEVKALIKTRVTKRYYQRVSKLNPRAVLRYLDLFGALDANHDVWVSERRATAEAREARACIIVPHFLAPRQIFFHLFVLCCKLLCCNVLKCSALLRCMLYAV